MRAAAAALLAGSALALVTGCGSTSTGVASGANLGTAAAQLVPADALAFASLDTNASSQQRKRLDDLTAGLPIRNELMQKLNAALSKHGLDLQRDVQPAVGNELDLTVLKVENGKPDVVALAKPSDESKLRQLASKLDSGSEHYTVEDIGGWSVVADSQASFAAVRDAQAGRSLADTSAYAAAQNRLGGDAIARVFATGAAVSSLRKALLPAAGGSAPAWISVKLSADGNALRLASSAAAAGPTPFRSALLGDVPTGASLAVSFKGGSSILQRLPAAKLGGLSLTQLAPLLTGEGVLYVRSNGLIPEVAIELSPANPRAALDHARTILSGAAGKLGPIRLTAQLSGGKLVIADTPAAASSLRGGSKLVDDAAFKDALKAAGVPQQRTGLVYANVAELAPILQLAAQAAGGKPLDASVADTLSRLGRLVAWTGRSGGVSTLDAWVEPR